MTVKARATSLERLADPVIRAVITCMAAPVILAAKMDRNPPGSRE